MFWWSWSEVKVTGGGAVVAGLEVWANAAAEQTNETARDLRNKCTLTSGNANLFRL
jgi:hypothetical protein